MTFGVEKVARSEKARFSKMLIFILLQAKSKVGGFNIETFWHPGATFWTSGNEVDFLIDFGCQQSPNEFILGPFWRPNPLKRASNKPSDELSKITHAGSRRFMH